MKKMVLTLVRSFGLNTSAPIVGVRSVGRATIFKNMTQNEKKNVTYVASGGI